MIILWSILGAIAGIIIGGGLVFWAVLRSFKKGMNW